MLKVKSGKSQQSSFDDRKETIIDEESYLQESKRADWRYEYEERKQYRCKIINSIGVITIWRKNCSECDYYLKRKSNKISLDRLYDEHNFEFESSEPTPEEVYQQKEPEEKVNETIASLLDKISRIVARMFADGASMKEIGVVTGYTKDGSRKKCLKVKKPLKEKLQDYWDSLH